MKDMTLVIMAAGMGSRFGGLKQIEPIGPNGEFIVDYSIYDAIQAGFNRVVFIIKRENFDVFKETVGSRIDKYIKVEYVFQDSDDIPEGYTIPETRVKPWGTTHAIYSARKAVKDNFVVINADDFYGRDAYLRAANFVKEHNEESTFALICYKAIQTLTESGVVKRGVCVEENGILKSITECYLEKKDEKIIATPFESGSSYEINDDTPVSMSMFCFTPKLFEYLNKDINRFFEANKNNLEKCEYLITTTLGEIIDNKVAQIKVGNTTAEWYGVTYKEDKDRVVKSIKALIDKGEYPLHLWTKK